MSAPSSASQPLAHGPILSRRLPRGFTVANLTGAAALLLLAYIVARLVPCALSAKLVPEEMANLHAAWLELSGQASGYSFFPTGRFLEVWGLSRLLWLFGATTRTISVLRLAGLGVHLVVAVLAALLSRRLLGTWR